MRSTKLLLFSSLVGVGKVLTLQDGEIIEMTFPYPSLDLTPLRETEPIEIELRFVYSSLQDCLKRISELNWVVRALP